MRLIDADKLPIYNTIEGIEKSKKGTVAIISSWVSTISIEEAPTVDAIPIEWIRGRLQKAVDFTHNKAEGNFIDNGCVVEVVSASFTANVLMNMLEDWEKENER